MSNSEERVKRLERRLEREKRAKVEAEEILNKKSRELYEKSVESEESKRLLEMALWASGESIWSWQNTENKFHFKEFTSTDLEVQQSQVRYDDLIERLHPDDITSFEANWSAHKQGLSTDVDACYRVRKYQNYAWLRFKGRVVSFDDNAAQTIIGTLKDVTDLIETETSSKLMSYAFSQSTDPMLIVNKSLRLVEANKAFCQLTGVTSQELSRYNLSKYIKFSASELRELQVSSSMKTEKELSLGVSSNIEIELSISEFREDDTSSEYYIVAIRDLTEKIKSERQLYTLAHFDPITHLLNRNALKKRYEDFVKSCDVDKLALFFIEIEGFKAISDQFGHEASDLLIAKQANDLQNQIELSDTLTRWGNSEFCFLQYFESDEALTSVIDDLCEFLSASKLDIEGHHVSSNYSIGVAKVEEQKPFEVLVRDADAAMFKAKSLGMNKYQVFYKGIADETLRRLRMLNELRTALADETLSFVLQGKYDKQRQLIGAEILCRWESDSFGQVSPAEFIPLIEQHGMESKLGLLAIKQAAIFSKSLNQFGLNIAISVNVSSPQIMDEGFLDDIIDICDRHGVEHQYIELEITESVFMFEDQNPSAILRDIQQAGFRISLDDFGTGYSSLSYLQQFQFDVVKVDRSFILELEDNERAYNLFLAIMNMCKALKTDTVVEGIETEEQFSILYKAGVNKFQGFLLGRPILLEDFLKDNLH